MEIFWLSPQPRSQGLFPILQVQVQILLTKNWAQNKLDYVKNGICNH